MSQARALIVDDEPDIVELLTITLLRMKIEPVGAGSVAEARACLQRQDFQLCLTDLRLGDGSGIDLVSHIQAHYPQTPCAVITAHGNMELAVQALKAGAFDFVSKPIDLHKLRSLIESALHLTPAAKAEPETDSELALLGRSPQIEQVRATIHKLARSQAPVYISGESGTGKELVARLIHQQGARAPLPFIAVNCGAIPSELMESEFFGHKKGSFTGAVQDKTGLFQAAEGGTLFLDEVADLSLPMQVKLLRAIQEKAIRPVGGEREIPVNVRILSATHKNLEQLVSQGQFRQDLYYRINVIELKIPPLRDRQGDIEILAERLLRRLAFEHGRSQVCLSPAALNALKSYHFPGNVRELENILERALTLAETDEIQLDELRLLGGSSPVAAPVTPATIKLADLDEEAGSEPDDDTNNQDLPAYLDSIQKETFIRYLDKNRWNRTATAKELGLTLRALRYRLKKLGIE